LAGGKQGSQIVRFAEYLQRLIRVFLIRFLSPLGGAR
jgi:hypothetical protein